MLVSEINLLISLDRTTKLLPITSTILAWRRLLDGAEYMQFPGQPDCQVLSRSSLPEAEMVMGMIWNLYPAIAIASSVIHVARSFTRCVRLCSLMLQP